MKNESVIATLAGQLTEVAKRIESLALTEEVLRANNSGFSVQCDDFLLDEIGHAQKIILELTSIVSADEAEPAANGDDSAFGPGDLNSVKGEKDPDDPDEKKE